MNLFWWVSVEYAKFSFEHRNMDEERRSSLKDTAPTMIAYGKLWVMIGYAKLWCAFGTVWKQAGDHIITFAKQTHNGEQMRAL